MATQTITYRRRKTRKEEKQPQQPAKPRRQNITRNNTTPSKVCPRCGGTGRVKA